MAKKKAGKRAAIRTRHRVGTSGWSYPDWRGVLYPDDARPGEFLSRYAEHFDTVEVDGSYYRTPTPNDCRRWAAAVPDDFVFTLKLPKLIVHGGGPRDRNLVDDNIWNWEAVGGEAERYAEALGELGSKCGAVMLQCPRYPKRVYSSWQQFADAVLPFLDKLALAQPVVLETRNGEWMEDAFLACLRSKDIGLVMADLRTTAGVDKKTSPQVHNYLVSPGSFVTGPVAVARLIGDRYEMDRLTNSWGKTVVDRRAMITEWAEAIVGLAKKKDLTVYAYANNHFAGHGPETARQLIEEIRRIEG
jgi:uncharacterized protein YecE (DUF72 family)